MKLLSCICCGVNLVSKLCDQLSTLITLGIRYWLFDVFFWSGYLKYSDWASTMFLFKHEYHPTWLPLPPPVTEYLGLEIPKMPPTLAAYTGTAMELILPVFVLLGLGGRIPAILLFIFNYIALSSYSFLWTDDGLAGLQNHYLWGSLCVTLICCGSGKISLDTIFGFFCRKPVCGDKKFFVE